MNVKPNALLALLLAASLLTVIPIEVLRSESYVRQRNLMVEEHLLDPDHGAGIADTRVIRAMRTVPRHLFVPESLRNRAYRNRPLPIGHDQTISQPYIVALMTQLLEPSPGDKILEIGTGSGYQAAVLAEIVDRVYTVEIIPELAEFARRNLSEAGYDNVTVRQGNGYHGWKEHAPFDGIIVTAAPESIPEPLKKQLKAGERIVIPVGPSGEGQQLMTLEKRKDGTFEQKTVLPVRFVPFLSSDPS